MNSSTVRVLVYYAAVVATLTTGIAALSLIVVAPLTDIPLERCDYFFLMCCALLNMVLFVNLKHPY